MPVDSNWRFNPFTELVNYFPINGEQKTVSYLSEWKIYGFVLDEAPKVEPNGNSLTVIEMPGGIQWTEVNMSVAPPPGSYRFDSRYGTGLVEFDASANGQLFAVSYSGEGSVMNAGRMNEMLAEGVLSIQGNRIAGFFENGRPFFRRIVSGVIAQNQNRAYMNHGLGNVVSERRVVGGKSLTRNPYLDETFILAWNSVTAYAVRDNDCYIEFGYPVPQAHRVWASIEYVI